MADRLIDYFVVIGSSLTNLLPLSSSYEGDSSIPSFIPSISNPLRIPYTPQILDRYPLEDHEDSSFPSGLTLFCLPEGMNLITRPKPASFFSFVQTSDTGSQLIGSCFTFYEPLNEKQRKCLDFLIDQSCDMDVSSSALAQMKFYLPRCLCIISQWPFVSAYKKFLCHIYRLSLTPCYIPLERYICNFVDEIPLPPSGKMEVSYFIGTETVHFTRPPCNEPQVWSMNMFLQPLFECLSFQNIISIITAILSERQIVFVSSQYSLLTLTAEAILSFIFPLKWTHVYIPILPKQLLGVLAAPLPFLVGIHTSFLPESDSHFACRASASFRLTGSRHSLPGNEPHEEDPLSYSHEGSAVFQPETMRVFLDTNEIDFGSVGAPPSLPESRLKKLLIDLRSLRSFFLPYWSHLIHFLPLPALPAFPFIFSKSAQGIDKRNPDWEYCQLPFYDSAFPMAVRPADADEVNGCEKGTQPFEFDSRGVHLAFLNVFTYLLQDYRKYLIHPSHSDPNPIQKFRTSEYLHDHPSECTATLNSILQSQAFYQFIEASVSNYGWSDPDILFFDESIEVQINRSSFLSFIKLDTPFLLDVSHKHAKTIVAPSPMDTFDDDLLREIANPTDSLIAATQFISTDKTGREVFRYSKNFPKLNPKLYQSRPKSSFQLFDATTPNTSPLKSVSRLKRVQSYSPKVHTPIPEACIYSTYLILFSCVLSSEYSIPVIKHNPPSLAQILQSRLHISRPLSISSGSGLSAHHDLILQSIRAPQQQSGMPFASTSVSVGLDPIKKSDLEKIKIDNLETLFGDIELVTFKPPPVPAPAPVGSEEEEEAGKDSSSVRETSQRLTQGVGRTGRDEDGAGSKGFLHYQDNIAEESVMIARAAMEILFEIFAYMEHKHLHIDETVYRFPPPPPPPPLLPTPKPHPSPLPSFRSLAEACAVCSASDRVVSLLESMISHGMVPDMQISIAVARTLYFSTGDISDETADSGRSDVPLFLPVTPKEVSEAVLSKDLKRLRSSIRRKGGSYHYPLGNSSSSFSNATTNTSTPTNTSSSINGGANPPSSCSSFPLSPLHSRTCHPQLSLANRILDVLYPDLNIDLSHPEGTTCPSFKCQKTLSFIEIISNFTSNVHQYTVNCPHCGIEFVPRFTVFSSLGTWTGSEGIGTLLWCEFLSPWTLQKEILNIIESNGISSILSSSFRETSTSSSQYSTIFWNLIVYFRHYGLPYAFLITSKLNLALLIS